MSDEQTPKPEAAATQVAKAPEPSGRSLVEHPHRPRGPTLTRRLTLSGLLFLLCALIGVLSTHGRLRAVDEGLARRLPDLYHPVVTFLLSLITYLGDWRFVGGLIVVAGAVLWRRGRWAWAAALAFSAGGAGLLDKAVKVLVARPRPPSPLHLETGYSFPSGHVMVAVGFYGMCAWLVLGSGLSRRVKAWAVAAAVLVTVLVGVSRVYLGVHWLSDVLGAYAAGTAWLTLCETVLRPTLRPGG